MPGPKRGARRAKLVTKLAVGKSRADTIKNFSRQFVAKIYACDGLLEKDGVGRMISEKISLSAFSCQGRVRGSDPRRLL